MNAFVKTINKNFPNQNFYLAWKGFVNLGYDAIKFEEVDIDNSSFWMTCNRSTPVFAGVATFDKILAKLNVTYNKIDTYPEILYPFLNRKVEKSTLGKFKSEWEKCENIKPIKFIKPIDQKKFTGKVIKSILDWITLLDVPHETEIYLVSPVKFLSEFRIYIQDNKIIVGKHYAGDWTHMVDLNVVKNAILEFYSTAPCAYALDFGVTADGKTTLIEFNDATSLGNYGIDSTKYAHMLVARWMEICQ